MKVIRQPCALDREKGGSMTRSDQTMRQFDDGKSKTIAKRDHFFWTCQVGRAAKIGGTVEGLDEALHAKKIRMVELEALLYFSVTMPDGLDQQGNLFEPMKVKGSKGEEIDCVMKQKLFDYVLESRWAERQSRPHSDNAFRMLGPTFVNSW